MTFLGKSYIPVGYCTFSDICLTKTDKNKKSNDMGGPGILFWESLHVTELNMYHGKIHDMDIISHLF